jgi:peptidoglycan/LPS O-acetylase OafA/YrhL
MHFRILDSWRGVAALLVALFHLNVYSALYSLDFMRNAYLFVDFFFVLSGFVITHSYAHRLGTLEGLGIFAVKRLGRLWPLHVVVLLAFIIVESGKAFLASRGAAFFIPPFTGPNSLDTIGVNLAFAQSIGIVQHLTWNPPSWSISAEFWVYLIFAIALFIATTWLGRIRFATGVLMAALLTGSAAILILFAPHGIDATYDLGLFRCLYGFLVGYLTYRLWQTVSHVKPRAGVLEAVTLIAVFIFVSSVGRTGYSFLAPFVFAVFVFVFAFESGPISRLMSNSGNQWLGRISYSIYMWQAFIIFNFVDRPVSIVEKMTGRVLTTTDSSSALGSEAAKLIVLGGHLVPILVTLLYAGLLIAVASVSYHWIEKPGQQLFARLEHWRWRRSISPAQDDGRSKGRPNPLGASAGASPVRLTAPAREEN